MQLDSDRETVDSFYKRRQMVVILRYFMSLLCSIAHFEECLLSFFKIFFADQDIDVTHRS